MSKRTIGSLITVLMIAGGVALASPGQEHPAAAEDPRFAMLAKLVGTWVRADDSGQPTGEVVSVFSLTGAGSALVETMFPGSEHEMMTVYHRDGDDVMLTHYCALGNQPRMRARDLSEPGKVVFECAGGTNMSSEDDKHMHRAELRLIDDQHLVANWWQFEGGKSAHEVTFNLVRKRP